VTGWLLPTLVATTAMMLLVLALRRPVARFFGAGWAYALWLIPALRLILPPLPAFLPLPMLSSAAFIPAAEGATAPPPVQAGPGQWVPLVLATWAGGAVIFLILQWLAYRSFARHLDDSARPARPARYGGILTFVSHIVEGPLALGLVEPKIFVPSDFSRRYSPSERRLAMEHELTHHRHRDIWWNVAALLVLALNWCNPIAWIAFRAFRTDQELACDAAVTARAGFEERCDYARALVKSSSRPGLVAACPIGGAGELKRRLRMMRVHRASAGRSAGGFAALALVAATGAATAMLAAAPEAIPVAAIAAVPTTVRAAPVRLASAAKPSAVPESARVAAVPRVRHHPSFAPSRPSFALASVEPKLSETMIQPDVARLQLILPSAGRPMRALRAARIELHTAVVVSGTLSEARMVILSSLPEESRAQVEAAIERAFDRAGEGQIKIRLRAAPDSDAEDAGGSAPAAINIQTFMENDR
jgi:bla regulator protein BlaR1